MSARSSSRSLSARSCHILRISVISSGISAQIAATSNANPQAIAEPNGTAPFLATVCATNTRNAVKIRPSPTSVSHACPLRARVLSHGRPMPAKHGTIGSIWLPENRITAFNPDGNAMSTTPIPANMAGFEAFASVRRTESLAEGESVDCSNPV